MSNIPNTEYVTITEKGCFIGGNPTRYYRSAPIYRKQSYIAALFLSLQKRKIQIQEIHALTSETQGTPFKPGEPSEKAGKNLWCRVKMIDGTIGKWTFLIAAESIDVAEYEGICGIMDNVAFGEFGMAVLPDQERSAKHIWLSNDCRGR